MVTVRCFDGCTATTMKPALSFLCLLTAAFPYWWVAQQLGVVEAYTVYDDATWAVVTANLMDPHKQAEYDDFMNECRKSAGEESASQYCDKDEAYRLQMNMYQPRSVSYKSVSIIAVHEGCVQKIRLSAPWLCWYTYTATAF